MVAPSATTGSLRDTTSPVTLAPSCSSTRPLKTTTSPSTSPEMVTGASKVTSDPLTVPSTAEEPWKTTRSPTSSPSGTSARPDKTTKASSAWSSCAHAGVARLSSPRVNSPTVMDRRIPIASNRSLEPRPLVNSAQDRSTRGRGCHVFPAAREADQHIDPSLELPRPAEVILVKLARAELPVVERSNSRDQVYVRRRTDAARVGLWRVTVMVITIKPHCESQVRLNR